MKLLRSLARWNGDPKLWPGLGFAAFALLLALVLAGMVAGLHYFVFDDTLRERAEFDMILLDGDLEDYARRTGHAPDPAAGLAVLLEKLPEGRSIRTSLPLDPWGHPYGYELAISGDGPRVSIRSRGANPFDSADDVVHVCAPVGH